MGKKMMNGLTPKMAVVGSLALAAHAPAAVNLSGLGAFHETAASSGGTVPITDWAAGPAAGDPSISYPYLEVGEYFTAGGVYDSRVFVKVNLSSVVLPANNEVTGAKLGLFWYDSTYGGYHPAHGADNVDLWSTADEFTGAVNFATYDGANAWMDGPQAGIDGYARTGPAGRHLASLYKGGTEPVGTPSSKVIDLVQEYKIFEGGNLDDYLTAQLVAGKDAYFALSIDNDGGFYQRFISTSDNGTYWVGATGLAQFGNQPYLELDFAEIPEPASGLAILALSSLGLRRRRRA